MANIITMNIHEALAKVKLYEKKINKSIRELSVLGLAEKDANTTKKGKDIATLKSNALSEFRSISDMIKVRELIAREIMISNASTSITVAGKDMKVAEAIRLKEDIGIYQDLVGKLEDEYSTHTSALVSYNNKVHEDAVKMASTILSSDEKRSEKMEQYIMDYEENKKLHLIDPIDIEIRIKMLDTWIDDFLSEVDHKLSSSNAVTTITIEI